MDYKFVGHICPNCENGWTSKACNPDHDSCRRIQQDLCPACDATKADWGSSMWRYEEFEEFVVRVRESNGVRS